eukprot:CAMPEP_0202450294 /NCGR_PEP_ID=MMETSP1360-20130828/8914_1 /ASSEMBLY_ACC=CAM_ASM_000848 /TAXON_ID=515479 /ORGANISM="Licmophora paradoxa, Strain CCMP2313" /LENGTH=463 /DNA_ID=CAMNT_0049068493 /DNA_START=282 /DNA_END=1673 /DNA_ORIENTATION=+
MIVYRVCHNGQDIEGAPLFDSPRIIATNQPDHPEATWFYDCIKGRGPSYPSLIEQIQKRQHRTRKQLREQQQQLLANNTTDNTNTATTTITTPLYWNIVIYDFTDVTYIPWLLWYTGTITEQIMQATIPLPDEENDTNNNTKTTNTTTTKIDTKNTPLTRYQASQYVRLITRGTVTGRNTAPMVIHRNAVYKRHYGRKYNFTPAITENHTLGGVKHLHFEAREDILLAIDEAMTQYLPATAAQEHQQSEIYLNNSIFTTNTNNTTSSPPPTGGGTLVHVDPVRGLARPIDVAHFWQSNQSGVAARVRGLVSRRIEKIQHPTRNLTIITHTVGNKGRIGRNNVQHEYINAMLRCKIIVVAQRDRYEDHYRLLETMLTGALVLTDPYVRFPWGVVHNETVVVYQSMSDLKEHILYYVDQKRERLRIAAAGRQLALQHHRRRHRFDDLLLGDWEQRDEYGVSLSAP